MREKVSAPITSTRFAKPARDVEVGGGDRIDEAAADGLHVEGKAVPHAEPLLDLDGGRRKGVVRRRGRKHDEVDIVRRQPGIGERCARRRLAQRRGRLVVADAMWRWRMPVRCTIHSSEVSTHAFEIGCSS